MLSSPTPFPYVGSYALIEHEGEITLARIVMRSLVRDDAGVDTLADVVVALPLVDGASGNLRVTLDRLIDATPLTGDETREFHDLDRSLLGREPRNLSKAQRANAKRRDALKKRVIYAPILNRLLRQARAQAERRAA